MVMDDFTTCETSAPSRLRYSDRRNCSASQILVFSIKLSFTIVYCSTGSSIRIIWLIAEHDYKARGCAISADEIFVSDGAKSDSGNIVDIFSINNKIAITDPVYPVYLDTNVMSGRTGNLFYGFSGTQAAG